MEPTKKLAVDLLMGCASTLLTEDTDGDPTKQEGLMHCEEFHLHVWVDKHTHHLTIRAYDGNRLAECFVDLIDDRAK